MTEILKISYGDEFALSDDFDLNQLRKIKRVSKLKDKYIADVKQDFELSFGETLVKDEEEKENLKFDAMKQDKEQYERWWSEGNTEKNKLNEKIKCLQIEIDELKKEA